MTLRLKDGSIWAERWSFQDYWQTIRDYEPRFEKPYYYWSDIREKKIDVEKIKKVKKTINLTKKDDSPMVIATALNQALRKASSLHHVVELTFLEWTTMDRSAKLNYLRWLLERQATPWAVNEVEHSDMSCTYRLAYPTLADL